MAISFWVDGLEYIHFMPSLSHTAIKHLLWNSALLTNKIVQLPPTLGCMPVRYACSMCCADFSFNGITKMNDICRHISVSALWWPFDVTGSLPKVSIARIAMGILSIWI